MAKKSGLRHKNYTELAEFAQSVYAEYMRPGSKLRDYFNAGMGSPAPQAFQQFIIEVGDGYGFGGISHMSPREWFNSDLPMRQDHADVIAVFYNRYKAVSAERVSESKGNSVQTELKRLQKQVTSMNRAMKRLMEAAEDEKVEEEEDEDKVAEEEDTEKTEEADDETTTEEDDAEKTEEADDEDVKEEDDEMDEEDEEKEG